MDQRTHMFGRRRGRSSSSAASSPVSASSVSSSTSSDEDDFDYLNRKVLEKKYGKLRVASSMQNQQHLFRHRRSIHAGHGSRAVASEQRQRVSFAHSASRSTSSRRRKRDSWQMIDDSCVLVLIFAGYTGIVILTLGAILTRHRAPFRETATECAWSNLDVQLLHSVKDRNLYDSLTFSTLLPGAHTLYVAKELWNGTSRAHNLQMQESLDLHAEEHPDGGSLVLQPKCSNNPLMQRLAAASTEDPHKIPLIGALSPPAMLELMEKSSSEPKLTLPECEPEVKQGLTLAELKRDPLIVLTLQKSTATREREEERKQKRNVLERRRRELEGRRLALAHRLRGDGARAGGTGSGSGIATDVLPSVVTASIPPHSRSSDHSQMHRNAHLRRVAMGNDNQVGDIDDDNGDDGVVVNADADLGALEEEIANVEAELVELLKSGEPSGFEVLEESLKIPKTEQTLSERELIRHGFAPMRMAASNGDSTYPDCKPPHQMRTGVLGIRDSFRRVFLHALNTNASRIIVMEDDVMLRNDFDEQMERALSTSRCGGFMGDSDAGGVLMLGASDYGSTRTIHWGRGNEAMTSDLDRGSGNEAAADNGIDRSSLSSYLDPFSYDSAATRCYNANPRTYGAFAVVYHRNVFVPILDWLDQRWGGGAPFDHIFRFLSLRGFTVRVLLPMAALADVIHSSASADVARTPLDPLDVSVMLWRMCGQHWDVEHFAGYSHFLKSRGLTDFHKRRATMCQVNHLTLYEVPIVHLLLIHLPRDVGAVVTLVDLLVEKWYQKLDGRTGRIVRPIFIVDAYSDCEPGDMPAGRIMELMPQLHSHSYSRDPTSALQCGYADADAERKEEFVEAFRRMNAELYAPVLTLNRRSLAMLKRTAIRMHGEVAMFNEIWATEGIGHGDKQFVVPDADDVIWLMDSVGKRTGRRRVVWHTLTIPQQTARDAKAKAEHSRAEKSLAFLEPSDR